MHTYAINDAQNIVVSSSGASVIAAPSEAIPEAVRNTFRANPIPAELARRAGMRVLYNNVDITVDIAPWLLSAEVTDGLEKADDLQLTLWDDGRWRDTWSPDEGAVLSAEIYVLEKQTSVRLPCGTFSIDEIEYSGPPNTASIKATSAYITTALRREKKTRAWEKITLREIAQTIASKAGMTLFYSARNNPSYARMDQKSRSDLDFLTDLAEREGLRIKTSGGRLVVYSQTEKDSEAPIETFYWGDMRIVSYQFTFGVTNAYSRAIVKYRKAGAKQVFEYTYVPDDAPDTGQTLRISEKCDSLAEAQRIAENRLTAANRGITDGSLSIVGDVRMLAGQNITAAGFGSKIDGDYAVEEARHSLWPYVTNLTLRKI